MAVIVAHSASILSTKIIASSGYIRSYVSSTWVCYLASVFFLPRCFPKSAPSGLTKRLESRRCEVFDEPSPICNDPVDQNVR